MVRHLNFAALVCIMAGNSVIGQLYGPNRGQTINNIFQIPIQTLSAISTAAQNTRPIGDVVIQRLMRVQQLQNSFQQLQQQSGSSVNSAVSSFTPVNRPYYSSNIFTSQQINYSSRGGRGNYPTRASQVAGLGTASDGSGFRI